MAIIQKTKINPFAQMQGPAQPAQPGQQPAQTKQPAGSFTNINRIMQSNVGAGQKYADKMSAGFNRDVDKTREAVGAAGQFSGQANTQASGITADAQKIADAVASQQAEQTRALGENGQIDPRYTNVVAGVNQAGQLQTDYGIADTKASGLIGGLGQQNQALQTNAGRSGLLSRYLNRPGYGTGMGALDQTLLQTEGQKSLAELKQKSLSDYLGQQSALKTTGETFGKSIEGLNKASDDAVLQLLGEDGQGGALGTGLKTFSDIQNAEVTDANLKLQQTLNNIKTNLSKGLITREEADLLGIQAQKRTFNVVDDLLKNPNKYLDSELKNELGNMINKDDYSFYNTLDKLLASGKGREGLGAGMGITGVGNEILSKDLIKKSDNGQTQFVSDVDARNKSFWDQLPKDNFSGSGSWDWHSSAAIGGGSGTERATSSMTGAELMKLLQQLDYKAQTTTDTTGSTGNYNPASLSGIVDTIGNALTAGSLKDLSGASKKEASAQREARRLANENLEKYITEYLKRQGYDDTLSIGAPTDTSMIKSGLKR